MGSSMLLQLPAWLKRIRLSMLRWVFDLTVDPWLWNFIQWFEKEDVKGKELSVNAVLDLNPEFRLADEPAQSVGKLAKDVKIKIKRSNGVVHAATITSLVEENSTVNVEVRFWPDRRSLTRRSLIFHGSRYKILFSGSKKKMWKARNFLWQLFWIWIQSSDWLTNLPNQFPDLFVRLANQI